MQKCAVYAYDAFQFEDDGFVKEAIGLGSWSCQELDFAKRFYSSGSYVRLQNEIFRQLIIPHVQITSSVVQSTLSALESI